MEKAAAMRARLIEQIPSMLRRPGMWANNGQAFERLCLMRLEDLLFLDGLPEVTRAELGVNEKYGSCGVPGPFQEAFGNSIHHYDQVASVYAEIFHRFGYLAPEHLVPAGEWASLLAAADSAYTGHDARLSAIADAFGPPSFEIVRRVFCYAPDDGTGWVFFDGSDHRPDVYDLEQGQFTWGYPQDPLLRSIRLPGDDFEQSLRLTRHGEALRERARLERRLA
jgi:hypothetical protein